jgi:hypothetical protein
VTYLLETVCVVLHGARGAPTCQWAPIQAKCRCVKSVLLHVLQCTLLYVHAVDVVPWVFCRSMSHMMYLFTSMLIKLLYDACWCALNGPLSSSQLLLHMRTRTGAHTCTTPPPHTHTHRCPPDMGCDKAALHPHYGWTPPACGHPGMG